MPMKQIRRVAVLGAGTMGSRIAAHIANAGVPVVLLDMVLADVTVDAGPAARNAPSRLISCWPGFAKPVGRSPRVLAEGIKGARPVGLWGSPLW